MKKLILLLLLLPLVSFGSQRRVGDNFRVTIIQDEQEVDFAFLELKRYYGVFENEAGLKTATPAGEYYKGSLVGGGTMECWYNLFYKTFDCFMDRRTVSPQRPGNAFITGKSTGPETYEAYDWSAGKSIEGGWYLLD